MKNTDWLLKVPQFSIHGESATPKEVERLASELMKFRRMIIQIHDMSGFNDLDHAQTSPTRSKRRKRARS